MSEFSQLVKKFDKIRDYMRDFYVYGFKSRGDFTKKSARTYDNEKRRCESYLGEYMKWDYSKGSKISFVSVDCGHIPQNPLYNAWKSKSFTSNDIMLHFYILDALKDEGMPVDSLTDKISWQSGVLFDTQTVRNKCNEYVRLGIISSEKKGKAFVYSLSSDNIDFSPELLDSVKFFQGCSPFGVVGSFILDNENENNDLFRFKHQYIAHTLEDGILLEILECIRKNQSVIFENHSERTGRTLKIHALPLKIFVSSNTGRRYVCMYSFIKHRFTNFRLDYIKKITPNEIVDFAPSLREKLDNRLDNVWGVCFGGAKRIEIICMKLRVNENTEGYIINRIKREGQGGTLVKLDSDTFLYTKEIFDSNDMSPWIKTFTGRIIQLEGTNRAVIDRFYEDIKLMADMYETED